MQIQYTNEIPVQVITMTGTQSVDTYVQLRMQGNARINRTEHPHHWFNTGWHPVPAVWHRQTDPQAHCWRNIPCLNSKVWYQEID